jgi:hypothetical protein
VLSKEAIEASDPPSARDLKPLRQWELAIIESAIKKAGSFSEIHLVIERGRVKQLSILLA